MRPSSLGGAAYCVALCLSVCLSVRPSVCPSVPLSLPSFTSRHLANYNDTHVLFGRGPHIVRPSRPHKFLFILHYHGSGIRKKLLTVSCYWRSSNSSIRTKCVFNSAFLLHPRGSPATSSSITVDRGIRITIPVQLSGLEWALRCFCTPHFDYSRLNTTSC